MPRQVKIVVSPDGVTMDYGGFAGESCKQSHEDVLKAMKGKGCALDLEATISQPKVSEALGNDRQMETI